MSTKKNWQVGEPGNVYEYLEENQEKINVGDTVEYVSNNQMGWEMYDVVLNKDGKKELKLKSNYDSLMEEGEKSGGKKKRRKTSNKKSKKRKGKKNRKTKGRK